MFENKTSWTAPGSWRGRRRLRLLEPESSFVTALGEQRRPMTGLNELHEQGKMTWIEQEHG